MLENITAIILQYQICNTKLISVMELFLPQMPADKTRQMNEKCAL